MADTQGAFHARMSGVDRKYPGVLAFARVVKFTCNRPLGLMTPAGFSSLSVWSFVVSSIVSARKTLVVAGVTKVTVYAAYVLGALVVVMPATAVTLS